MTVKSSISLTDEQHAFARALVDAGRYSSVSAVLQQGVDLLRQRMDAEEVEPRRSASCWPGAARARSSARTGLTRGLPE